MPGALGGESPTYTCVLDGKMAHEAHDKLARQAEVLSSMDSWRMARVLPRTLLTLKWRYMALSSGYLGYRVGRWRFEENKFRFMIKVQTHLERF